MPLYLAIDAGGTKTRCLLADETRVLARASTGTVKLMRVAEVDATARLSAMLDEVAAGAGVTLADVKRTCFGLAGSSSAAVREWARKAIAGAGVGGELSICGDEEIALDAAFQGGPGILVIAGTGSNAIGRSRSGGLFGAGGWGPVVGDEGSGYWIGLEAIRVALHARDQQSEERSATLLKEIQREWKLGSLGDLVALGNLRAPSETAPPDFASLAPVVARCAAFGDVLAQDILRRAGNELAELVALVARKMAETLPFAADEAIPVVYTGSVLEQIEPVRQAMIARLAETVRNASVRPESVDPLDGALWRARSGPNAGP